MRRPRCPRRPASFARKKKNSKLLSSVVHVKKVARGEAQGAVHPDTSDEEVNRSNGLAVFNTLEKSVRITPWGGTIKINVVRSSFTM